MESFTQIHLIQILFTEKDRFFVLNSTKGIEQNQLLQIYLAERLHQRRSKHARVFYFEPIILRCDISNNCCENESTNAPPKADDKRHWLTNTLHVRTKVWTHTEAKTLALCFQVRDRNSRRFSFSTASSFFKTWSVHTTSLILRSHQ